MKARSIAVALAIAGLALGCGDPAELEPTPETPSPEAAVQEPGVAVKPPTTTRIGTPRRAGGGELTAAATAVDEEHSAEPVWQRPTDLIAAGERAGELRLSRAAPETAALSVPVFFGLMHAHTFISDGSGTPEEAFEAAKAAGLDFLGVSPHNHAAAEAGAKDERRDGVLIANTPALYDGADPVKVTRHFSVGDQELTEEVATPSLRSAAAAATDGGFAALFGQEFSTISSGNHANVFQPPSVISDIADGAYRPFYERFGAVPVAAATVVQLNHPDVHEDLFYGGSNQKTIAKMFNDYGYDEYDEDFADLVAAARPIVALVEVLSGPALDPHEHASFHYADGRLHEDDYYFYLIQGFHVSPSVGQDNHFPTWGTATPARMGVYAAARTPEAIIAAMRANRTYATEDSDLVLDFRCNGAGMGSVLAVPQGDSLLCSVSVTDPSDANATYEVELIYGDVLPARSRDELVEWKPGDGRMEARAFEGSGMLAFDEYLASGVPEFFYVRVQQGDGDRAWSAPIWVNHPRTR